MNIGGFQEISLLDYPGKITTIIWTTGCNFRCPFCFNPNIVLDKTDHISNDVQNCVFRSKCKCLTLRGNLSQDKFKILDLINRNLQAKRDL